MLPIRSAASSLARRSTEVSPAFRALATSTVRPAQANAPSERDTNDQGLPDPVGAGGHSTKATGQRWGPGQNARFNVPLENTPLFLFVGFVVSIGLGTISWNYMKSDDIRKTPGPDPDRWQSNSDPAYVKDHPPKNKEE